MGSIINRRMRFEAQKELIETTFPSVGHGLILAIPRPEVTVVHPVRIGQGGGLSPLAAITS